MSTRRPGTSKLSQDVKRTIIKKYGAAGFIEFLQGYGTGTGDYTKDRKKILPRLSVDEIAEELRNLAKKTRKKNPNRKG